MSGGALVTFMATTEEGYNRALASGKLSPGNCTAPSCPWVPLKESEEAAMESALRSPKFEKHDWPTQEHVWCVLRLCFTPQQATQAFQQHLLTSFWPANDTSYAGGYRWHGAISLADFAHEWTRLALAPTGYEAWADRHLAKITGANKVAEGVCAGCGGMQAGWAVGSRSLYCAACWHEFICTPAEPEDGGGLE